MALLGNYSVLHKSPAKFLTGTTSYGDQANWNKPGMMRSRGAGSDNDWKLASIPQGFGSFGAWMLPRTSGAMTSRYATFLTLSGLGNGALGVSKTGTATLTLDGSGSGTKLAYMVGSLLLSITALSNSVRIGTPGNSSIILSSDGVINGVAVTTGSSNIILSASGIIASMLGASGSTVITITANGLPYAMGFLDGNSEITIDAEAQGTPMIGAPGASLITIMANADMNGLGHIVGFADLQMAATLISYALGWMDGTTDIPTGDLTAEEIAIQVWAALQSEIDNPGTAGAALLAAGSAGDPWITELPGSYPPGSAGDIIGKRLLTLAKFLGLK